MRLTNACMCHTQVRRSRQKRMQFSAIADYIHSQEAAAQQGAASTTTTTTTTTTTLTTPITPTAAAAATAPWVTPAAAIAVRVAAQSYHTAANPYAMAVQVAYPLGTPVESTTQQLMTDSVLLPSPIYSAHGVPIHASMYRSLPQQQQQQQQQQKQPTTLAAPMILGGLPQPAAMQWHHYQQQQQQHYHHYHHHYQQQHQSYSAQLQHPVPYCVHAGPHPSYPPQLAAQGHQYAPATAPSCSRPLAPYPALSMQAANFMVPLS